jgi:osmotically-inducible protein OsmY
MKSNSMKILGATLRLGLAGALLLGLAACDRDSQAENPAKSFDRLVQDAGRDREAVPARTVPADAGMSQPQSGSPDPATDLVLAARVKAALSADPGLRSVTVDVKSTDGVVTLYGTADSAAKSHQASMVALNVDGVRSVRNEMVIVRGS